MYVNFRIDGYFEVSKCKELPKIGSLLNLGTINIQLPRKHSWKKTCSRICVLPLYYYELGFTVHVWSSMCGKYISRIWFFDMLRNKSRKTFSSHRFNFVKLFLAAFSKMYKHKSLSFKKLKHIKDISSFSTVCVSHIFGILVISKTSIPILGYLVLGDARKT